MSAICTDALSNLIYLVFCSIDVVRQDLIGAPQEGRNL
jgi:hypothetical protein